MNRREFLNRVKSWLQEQDGRWKFWITPTVKRDGRPVSPLTGEVVLFFMTDGVLSAEKVDELYRQSREFFG